MHNRWQRETWGVRFSANKQDGIRDTVDCDTDLNGGCGRRFPTDNPDGLLIQDKCLVQDLVTFPHLINHLKLNKVPKKNFVFRLFTGLLAFYFIFLKRATKTSS